MESNAHIEKQVQGANIEIQTFPSDLRVLLLVTMS